MQLFARPSQFFVTRECFLLKNAKFWAGNHSIFLYFRKFLHGEWGDWYTWGRKLRNEEKEMAKSVLSYKLRDYREQEGLTQLQLAELLDVSDKSISKWELGEGYPSKRNLAKISEVLGISIEALLIEQGQDASQDTKLSIKYGIVSYLVIFVAAMVVNSFRIDYSAVLQQGGLEIVKVLGAQFVSNNLLAIPFVN